MPTLSYNILASKNDGLAVSPSELANRYFFGIPIVDKSGNKMSETDMAFHVRAAMEEMEGYLNLKLSKQVIRETLHYNLQDYKNWGYSPTTFPVLCVKSLTGFIGQIKQVEWPESWLSIKRDNRDSLAHRAVYLVPTTGAPEFNSTVYHGIVPHSGWMGSGSIPNYWEITYITSFDTIPEDILQAVGQLASISIFHQLGDIILGAGIASQSIGIDGLSQSISTTSSATNAGYGARITGYVDDLKRNLPKLKAKYDGMTLMSM